MEASDTTPSPTTKSAWKKANQHTITLPSGQVVDVKVPNLPVLIKGGQIPNELVDIAIGQAQSAAGGVEPKVDRALIEKLPDYHRFLVSVTVTSPKIEQDEVDDLPFEDIEMIVEIATRQREFDAVGHHLAGLETVKSFRSFRGLDAGLPGLVGE